VVSTLLLHAVSVSFRRALCGFRDAHGLTSRRTDRLSPFLTDETPSGFCPISDCCNLFAHAFATLYQVVLRTPLDSVRTPSIGPVTTLS